MSDIYETCVKCGGVLLWAAGKLICPRPHCPGHGKGCRRAH